ncbi:MMPL family transporter [Renibacterium salmoninarum ATCC 33209]|uniref:MMPL family transporter n=1 Tax=Renibacterium salmoninarum (strain ATCC 33209 / DSM 20767 / JCM 11484 / NBRC 15589 / NCIMB 2235) TaxID=288705 RepID=A9WM44_RENSM|nr:MMPL family transporter [Renibacterium salmoninarum ATCC 33209]
MLDKLKTDFPSSAGGSAGIVFESDNGFNDAQKTAISDALKNLATKSYVQSAVSPFETQAKLDGATAQIAEGQKKLDDGAPQLAAGKAQLAQLEAIPQKPAALETQYQALKAQIDAAEADAAAGEAKIAAAKLQAASSQGLRFVSENGKAAVAQVQFKVSLYSLEPSDRKDVQSIVNAAKSTGVQIYFSKEITEDVSELFGPAEIIGVVIAFIVLLVMLGTLIAAGLPLIMAVIGVGVGGTFALTGVIEMSSISPMLALMLGLAVGIDYSLFIVNRHRQQILAGMEMRESIARATGTSGKAVLFAGLTVVIALAALTISGLPFLGVLGLAAAATVAFALLIALTLTPAILSLLGRRIVSRRAWRKNAAHPGEADAKSEAKSHSAKGSGWGGFVTRHPIVTLAASVLALIVVALPAASLRLALPDGGSEPVDSSAFKSYQAIEKNFGAGMNGPIVVVGELPSGLTDAQVQQAQYNVADKLRSVQNVAAAVPVALSNDKRTAVFQVIPKDGPASASTVQVVHDLREAGKDIKASTGVQVGLTGQTAANVDVSAKLGGALPLYLAVVVGLSLILLLSVFRSIVVPLLATGGFLLSLAASFGGVVAVYQWGWLGSVFDVPHPAAVLSFLPIIVIGVLFGLAMDYQVFITSGMREAFAHGENAKQAVRTGFGHAAKVVVAAAIIMTSVFAGFIFSHLTMIRPMGFALAFGVLIDAFVVRMTIVPAAMHLLGKSAWWLPKWLNKILPDVDVEGAKVTALHESAETATADPRDEDLADAKV